MPIFEVTAPDGKIIEVTAPDGATEDQAIAYAQQQYKPEQIKPDTGFTGAAKGAAENLKSDLYALAGRAGVMDAAEAERQAKSHKARAEKVFTPTQESWTEAPFTKFKELAGGSVPYMVAPMVAGASTMLLPEVALAGGLLTAADLAAGAVGVAQFTGSNLSRQMETGKHLEETNLLAAGAAAVPQAALDVFGLRMIPGVRKIFGQAGVPISDKAAEQVAKTGLLATTGSFLKQGVKTAGAEGLTEAGQQVFERLQAGLNLTNEDARKEYFENFLGGAALGGVLAIPGHAMERMGKQPQPGEEPPEPGTPIAPTANAGVENPVTMAGVGEIPQVPRTQFAPPIVQPTAPVVETPTAAVPPAAPAAPVAPVAPVGGEQNRDRSAAASIAQMNKIAANPIYEFVGVDPKMTSGAPIVTGPVSIPENQLGKKSHAIAENGTKIPVQYAVVDAGSVLPSHNVDGTPNAGYTPEHEGLRSVVGNGRTAGLQASYARGLANNYREQLTADNTHGVPKEVIEGMKNPMLVRFTPQSEVPANIGDISNVAGTMSLSAIDQAKNDANRVDLNALQFGDDGQVTRNTIRGFVQGMPTTEQAQLIDSNGNTTRQAHDRLNAAIFHLAYNNDALTHLAHESGDEESQNIIRAMSNAAPQMAQLNNAGEYDVRPAVVAAAQTAINARRQGHKLSDFLKQTDMMADPLTNHILKLFAENPRSPNKVAESLKSLAQKINEEVNAPESDMFGPRPKRNVNQIIAEHFGEPGAAMPTPVQPPAAKPKTAQAGFYEALDAEIAKIDSTDRLVEELARLRDHQSPLTASPHVDPIAVRDAMLSRLVALDPARAAQMAQEIRRHLEWYSQSSRFPTEKLSSFASALSKGVAPKAAPKDAWPQDIPRTVYRGYGRATKESAYNGTAVPIVGDGRYYAFSEAEAKQFGPNIEKAESPVKNPFVIRDGDVWRKLTNQAGWQFPNIFGASEAEAKQLTDAVQDILRKQGHDGVIIYWDPKNKLDVGPNGENIKLLRNVFGEPQVVAFGGAAQVKPAPAAATGLPAPLANPAPVVKEILSKEFFNNMWPDEAVETLQRGYPVYAGKNVNTGTKSNQKTVDITDLRRLTTEAQIRAADSQGYSLYATEKNVETQAAPAFPNEKRGYQIDKPKDQIHAEVSKLKDHVALAQWAVDNAPNRFAKGIAEKVLKRLKEFKAMGIPMSVRVQNGTRRPTTRYGQSVWTIDKGGKTLHIDLSGTNKEGKTDEHSGTRYSTILHELLHSVTQAQLHMLGSYAQRKGHQADEIYRDLSDVLHKLKLEARKRGIKDYEILKGLKNVDELVAHGLTNDKFQDFMSSVKVGEKTAFTKLVQILRDILGLSPDYDSALDQLVRVTERALAPTAQEIEAAIQKVAPTYKFRTAAPEQIDQTQTPEFKRWSKGLPVYESLDNAASDRGVFKVFHATTGNFNEFVPGGLNKTDSGPAIWLSPYPDYQAAAFRVGNQQAGFREGANVMPLYARLSNPLVIDDKSMLDWARQAFNTGSEFPQVISQQTVNALKAEGYDSIIFKGEQVGWGPKSNEIMVFDPTQVKSAIGNKGTFSETLGGVSDESFIPDYSPETGNKYFKPQTAEARRQGYANSFKNPITLRDGTRLSGFVDPAKQTTFHGYDKNGNRITMRREYVNPDDIVFSKDGNKTAEYFRDKLRDLSDVAGIRISSQEENNVDRLTKTMPVQTQGQQVRQAATAAWNAVQNNQYRTSLRVAWIDKNSGLTKSLESQPTFDVHGQLRADMLARSQDQMINLVSNGLQSGIPVINSDGTLGIQRSENNLARSQIIADKLDGKIKLDGKKLSGRDAVAEVARILRGKDILAEDAKRRRLGERQMEFAKELVKLLKVARNKENLNPETGKPYTIRELQQIFNGIKYLRREGRKNKATNRELQVKPRHIAWAEEQLASHPELQQVLDIWKNVNDSLVTLWEQSGLFTKEQADEYRSRENYVPLFKSREDLENDPNGYGGTGAKTVKGVKQLHGSMATRNIWENIDKHYAAMVASAYQNQTRKVASNQLKALGLASIPEKNTDPAVNLRYRDPTDPFADSKGIVSVIIQNPNDLAAFQMMHYELTPLMKIMAGTTKVLRAGALINPMYWIKQLVRDPVHATMVSDSGIVTPFHAAKEYVNILMNNSEEAKILASRGVIGQIDSTIDIHDFLKQVGTAKQNPNLMDKMIHKVMKAHEASDAATRVAIYKKEYAAAKKRGLSEDHAVNYAVHKARESINFAVRGNSPTLNALRQAVPFLSAAITSLDTVYRAATGYGKSAEEKAQAKKIFYSRALMMAVMSTAYAMMYQDDEDYKKLPDYVKDNNFLIPNPFGEGHSFIRVATPFEVGFLFKTIPEAAVRYMRGTSTGREVLASYAHGLANNLPGGSIPPISLIPQAVKPIIEVTANYSFFTGRPIEGMGDLGLPVAARGGDRASELSRILSSYGLDKLHLSPAKLDYLIQAYTAELGTFSVGMASDAIYAAEGKTRPAKNIEEMPFNKAFMTNPNTSKAVADFFDLEHNAQEAVTQLNKLKATGMVEEAKSYVSDEQVKHNIAAANVLRGVGAQMTKLKQAMSYYTNKQDMDPELRRQKLNELEAQYHRVASQGYKIAESAGINR